MKINIKKVAQKGISLIALVITIAVMIIMAYAVIQKAVSRANDAKLSTYNSDILNFRQEAQSYISSHNGEFPVLLDSNGQYKVYDLVDGSSLKNEILSVGDAANNFYIIDLQKVGANSTKKGTGKDPDDYYIIGSKSGNVYYAKGEEIGGTQYFGVINKGTSKTVITQGQPGIPNPPRLGVGMVPQKFNGTSWVDTDTSNTNNDWYDYSNTGATANRWANVRLSDGSQLVWIPRFAYKITSGEHTNNVGTVDIKFINGTNDNNIEGYGYRIPTAFYWGGYNIYRDRLGEKVDGGTELTGIWVGKYEASDNNGKVQIKPGVVAIKNILANTMFFRTRSMQDSDYQTYGISSSNSSMDVHMMKDSEWGAVAYLSVYARGATEITINSNTSFYTAGTNSTTAYITNANQSATGNVYGIYDMSGGVSEYMASYIDNGNTNIMIYSSLIKNAEARYKDVFPVGVTDDSQGNYDALKYAYGHAIYEFSTSNSIWNGTSYTSEAYGWFGDRIGICYGDMPIVVRGGSSTGGGTGTKAGIFSIGTVSGFAYTNAGFRVALIVQ